MSQASSSPIHMVSVLTSFRFGSACTDLGVIGVGPVVAGGLAAKDICQLVNY